MKEALKDDSIYGVRLLEKVNRSSFLGYSRGVQKPEFIRGWTKPNESKFDGDLENFDLSKYTYFEDKKSGKSLCEIHVKFYDGSKNLTDYLKKFGLDSVRGWGRYYFGILQPCSANVSKKLILELSKKENIRSVNLLPIMVPTLNNISVRTGARQIWQGNTPYNVNYTGEGMIFGLWDFGRPVKHPDFKGRILGRECNFFSCSIFEENSDYHPTMTAGVLFGDGNLSNGFYKGIAPKSKGYFWDVLYAADEMRFAGKVLGISVSSNSWHFAPGFSLIGGFKSKAKSRMHDFSEEYNSLALEIPDVPLVFAAGNALCESMPIMKLFCDFMKNVAVRCDPEKYYLGKFGKSEWDCLYPPSSSKNTITVGSIGYNGQVSNFSSRGPTWDGRVKPDVVSIGEEVVTPYYNDTFNYFTYTYDGQYGTSFATPTVAGHIVLLQQFLNDLEKKSGRSLKGFRSALIKAALIHTARDVRNYTYFSGGRMFTVNTTGPDFLTGWGEIQPRKAMNVLAKGGFILDSFSRRDAHLVKRYPIRIPPYKNITKPLKVTLVWMDYPDYLLRNSGKSRDEARELVNNLDLSICDIGGSDLEYPFVLDWKNPGKPATKGFNDRDNVEQVILEPEKLRNYVTANTKMVYACVRFRNYLDSPDLNQKFVLMISDGNDTGSFFPTCGNKKLEPQYGEECEYLGYVGNRWDFGGKTCRDYAPNEPILGKLRCNAQCKIEADNCYAPLCGDGVVQLGESCDPKDPSSYKVGCYGYLDGPDKACKQMCVTDTDCTQRVGRQSCVDGVCVGCGDGEEGVGESCDPTSRNSVEVSCRTKFPKIKTTWSCYSCACFAKAYGTVSYWCKGKKVLSKPQCQKDAECKAKHPSWRSAVCNDVCLCEEKYRCKGKITTKKPQCQKNSDCLSTHKLWKAAECLPNCVCEERFLCKGKKTDKKPECQKDSDCLKNNPKWAAAECLSNCSCKEMFYCRRIKTDKRPQCQKDSDCGPDEFCNSKCACVPKIVDPSPCGLRTGELGSPTCGGYCPGKDEQCMPIYIENSSRGPGDPGIIKDCRCMPLESVI